MKKQILLRVLLCLTMAVGLLPTMVFASGVTGSGKEEDPYVYEVSTASELSEAVTAINADPSDSAHYYTISLKNDIECGSLSFSKNTTTILGNDHTLVFNHGDAIHVGSGTATPPVLILGGTEDTLTIKGNSSNDTYFIGVGAINGGTEYGTLKMCDGVTITGATGNNYFGGAVTVAGGGKFEMDGGTIKECGIDGGSVCFGGGVAVVNGGEFTMNGGSIQDCFLKTDVDYTDASYLQDVFGFDYQAANNLLVNSGAGAGVFVSNGAVFKMTGGEIKNNTISAKNESTKSYGVGGGIAVLAKMYSLDITARAEITGGTIEGNKATLGGGGIAVCGMMPFAYAISNSYAPGSGSGTTTPGLFINGTEENPVQIKKNSADGWEDYSVGGGGILLANLNDAAEVQIKNAEISENNVTTNAPGGGIECWSNISTRLYSPDLTANHLTVTNTVMSSNSAAKGGGICLLNGTKRGLMEANVSNTVITENTVTELGGGFSVEAAGSNSAGSTVVTFNESCAVYDNTADSGADDFYKNGKSTVNALPNAKQMSAAAKNAVISGWYEDKTENRYNEATAVEYTPEPSTTESLQLKAVKAAQYAVTFDWNDGSSRTETVSALAGTALGDQMPAAPTRSGYTFTGWSTQADGQGTVFNKDTVVNGTLTVYAQWSKNSGGGGGTTTYYYFAIEKVDAQDGHALNGAKFGLYLDSKQVATATSNRSGIALFRVSESDYRKINAKSELYYQELTAPEGYVVSGGKTGMEKDDLTTNQAAAEKKAEAVRNYRSSTPDLLNDADHFAYVIGYKDGNVRPYGLISRAETTTIFFRLLTDEVRDDNLLTSNTYTDVTNDYWANTAISTMTGLGIVQGRSATTFDPKAPITRAQFAAICARFDTGVSSGSRTFSDISGHWAEKYIERAAELGWIKGFEDGSFRPDTYITRAQAMTMINRVLNRIPEENGDLLAGMNVWPDCNPGDWFYLAVHEATNSHDFQHKAGNYETWTGMNKNPDWTRYEH